MVVVGLLITLAGFGLAVGSLGATTSTSVRLIMVLAGMVVSLVGILGVLNMHYQKNAIWKR